jgi:hypothetical protein
VLGVVVEVLLELQVLQIAEVEELEPEVALVEAVVPE